MKDAGSGLMALGGLAILAGFLISVGRTTGYGEVANLHAMHIQALVFHGGFFAFLSGAVLFAGGTINDSLRARSGTPAEPALETAAPDDSSEPLEPPSEPKEWWQSDFAVGLMVLIGMLAVVAVIAFSTSSRSPSYSPEPYISNDANMPAMDVLDNSPLPADLNATMPR